MLVLFSNFFLNRELATIVSTSGAYSVVDVPSSAVRADGQRGSDSLIVSSTFESSRF